MKKSITVFALLLVSLQTMKAQDILVLNDGARIEIKIIRETPDGIKYLRLDVGNSDTFTIKLADISYRSSLKDHKEIVLNGYTTINSQSHSTEADQPDTVNSFWFNFEGGSTYHSEFVYGLSLNLLHDIYLFSFEYLTYNMHNYNNYDSTISSTGSVFAGKTSDVSSVTTPSFSSYRLLFGKTFYLDSDHDYSFDMSAGLSLDNTTYTTVVTYSSTVFVLFFPSSNSTSSSSSTNKMVLGLPINLKLHFPTFTAFGIDLGIKGDISSGHSFISGTIGLRIGRISVNKNK